MAARFRDKVVWVTGASSGIGEAVALAFAREGARLILSARRADQLERVRNACAPFAADVRVLPLDLADLDALAGRAEQALHEFGCVDVMVHNAGVSQRSRAIETSVSVDEQLMRTNYLGTVALTKALLPAMVVRRAGHFVVVTSLTGVIGSPLRSGYAASKHALHGFFDSLRAEHERDRIAVTIVCPGYVHTDVSINALSGDGSRHGGMDQKTAQGISPEACARALVDATARKRTEVYVGGRETLAVYLKRLAPAVFARVLARAKVT